MFSYQPMSENNILLFSITFELKLVSLVDRAFFHFSHSLFFKQLVSYPKTWSKVVSIQMNQTDEHEHKLVLLGSKLDEKSGKACAGK